MFRNDSGRRGGVCIYVKDTLKSNPISLNAVNHPDIEDIYVTIKSSMLPEIIVACIYSHPKATADSFNYLNSILQSLCLRKKFLYT